MFADIWNTPSLTSTPSPRCIKCGALTDVLGVHCKACLQRHYFSLQANLYAPQPKSETKMNEEHKTSKTEATEAYAYLKGYLGALIHLQEDNKKIMNDKDHTRWALDILDLYFSSQMSNN